MPVRLPLPLSLSLVLPLSIIAVLLAAAAHGDDGDRAGWQPEIPKFWDDEAVQSFEVPLVDGGASPVHVPADLFYRLPERRIYETYPVYHPDHESEGYLEKLRQSESAIAFDPAKLKTREDWIRAGELVFDAPIMYDALVRIEQVRDREWYEATGVPVAADGTVPFLRYVVRRGKVHLGQFSCGTCHTRVMSDGTAVKGAQGNFPLNKLDAMDVRAGVAEMGDPKAYVERFAPRFKTLYGAPWLPAEEQVHFDQMTAAEIADAYEAIPAGVQPRFGASLLYPVVVPDLIGIEDRRYFDRTGHTLHRDIADLARYALVQQDVGLFARYGEWIPMGRLPDPEGPPPFRRARYSDPQLYALGLYLYSLEPPENPNPVDELTARGQKVFEREECWRCHTPPLYTSNRLTPVKGFDPPATHPQARDVVPLSVGTDAGLALKTRRGTGFYKVPSLLGVWYRGPFQHS
ncbi:MAG: hypothetical protein V3T72_10430, partial [Thermoanaerobaculia bacterium]